MGAPDEGHRCIWSRQRIEGKIFLRIDARASFEGTVLRGVPFVGVVRVVVADGRLCSAFGEPTMIRDAVEGGPAGFETGACAVGGA